MPSSRQACFTNLSICFLKLNWNSLGFQGCDLAAYFDGYARGEQPFHSVQCVISMAARRDADGIAV